MISEEVTSRKLTFPVDTEKDPESVSILEPLGTALLGCREGDIVEFVEEDEKHFLRVEKLLYQPESAGDFHL
jgi:regulator of nucleoside diphosphate kinase